MCRASMRPQPCGGNEPRDIHKKPSHLHRARRKYTVRKGQGSAPLPPMGGITRREDRVLQTSIRVQ